MYSICMIHSVLILNVPMFKRRTHKLSEQCLRGVQLTEHQYSFMNTTVLHVFNFKCLMFQIEHRQGVEPVFAFNICCIALNASLCSSVEHVLAFKICSMKNIIYVFKSCTLEVFNITEHVQGVQYMLHCWCSNCVLYLNTCSEHMQTFTT